MCRKKFARKVAGSGFSCVPFRENPWLCQGYPSPLATESLDWRGFCKNALQNLEPQELRGQDLDNEGVTIRLAFLVSTASALTMICRLNFEVKVGRHKQLRKNAGSCRKQQVGAIPP
jgi:hypothetical protein